MATISLRDMLQRALQGGYAVGYFEAWDQYSVEAILEAAEEACSPVVVGVGGVVDQPWRDRWGLRAEASIVRELAEAARVPVATLLNEVPTLAEAVRGLHLGFGAALIESQGFPYEENVAITRRLAETAHALGACAEGELGEQPDVDQNGLYLDTSRPTDPTLAARFVAETGVDALAVAIGNPSGLRGGQFDAIDLELLSRVHEVVPVPLVIHGASGFPPSLVNEAIRRGVAKFNVGTVLRRSFLTGLQTALDELDPNVWAYHAIGSRMPVDVLARAKAAMKETVAGFLAIYGSVGKADG